MSSGNKKKDFWVHFMAGGLGGTVGAAITCPLEVVKTRLQSSLYSPKALPGMHLVHQPAAARGLVSYAVEHVRQVIELLSIIKRREGVTALWKGLGPNLVGVVPARAIYFSTYNYGKNAYTAINKGQETPFVHMISAISAGVATSIATNPIWLVKTRMQLQSDSMTGHARKYRSSLDCLTSVVREEGVKGLYKGLSASILGLTETSLQFVLYEQMKKRILAAKMEKKSLERATNLSPPPKPSLDWYETFGVAATAKLFATITTYPHEVLRTRLRQVPAGAEVSRGLIQTARKIYLEEGMGALYGGLTAHLLRVVPNAAILFATVEFVLLYAANLDKK
ncbi:mitochondrial carrier domain-containing protein [Chytridium lagenaria]|nr:mitochondrial carrier domain-containing protein [Chytridium lagenaria]